MHPYFDEQSGDLSCEKLLKAVAEWEMLCQRV
jgi:hypothetical protein